MGIDLAGSLGRTEAAFGTIGTNAFERAAFWDIVDELERKPQTSGVMLDVALNPSGNNAWWLRALADGDPPSVLREWLTTGNATPLHVSLTEQEALEVIQWARSLATERGKPPVTVRVPKGRGGRVQAWLVASLPYELMPEGRKRVVEAFTATLQ